MRNVTPRIPQMEDAHQMIGRVLNHNYFPTLRGKLIYIHDEKCYFEIVENPEFTKYNHCAGQVEYLPEYMVVCMEFMEKE